MSDIQLKDAGLRALIAAFKNPPKARVGILGAKAGRESGLANNASIGAAHEFGTEHLPQRSFLRVPISTYLHEYLERAGAFNKEQMAEVIRTRAISVWVAKLGTTAEGIVREAFASQGFGQWAPWKHAGYTNNANQVLVDTQQLRNSITSDVKP